MADHHPIVYSPSGMELHCFVCPKRPNFSDESHLLTHIASKGHLSNYYKKRLAGDQASQQAISTYDEWYNKWDIQDLMKERISQKDKKKTGSSRRAPKASAAAAALAATTMSSRSTPVEARMARAPSFRTSLSRQVNIPNLVDPDLGAQGSPYIKQEHIARPNTPNYPYGLDMATFRGGFAPPMPGWPAPSYNPSLSSRNGYSLPSESFDGEDDDDAGTSYSPEPRRVQRRSNRRKRSSDTTSLRTEDILEIDELANDESKLKGQYWPGMDCFDSATPEMRRKRNQKKDYCIVNQLMSMSNVIKPVELIFDTAGEKLKEREIDGNPEIFDPLPGETSPEPEEPVPKKKAGRRPRQPRQPREALSVRDPNSGRTLRSASSAGSHHGSLGAKRRTPYFDSPVASDDEATYGRPKKRRSGLSIHRDNSGPEITFSQPTSLDCLTSSFNNPFNNGPHGHLNSRQSSFQRPDINGGLFPHSTSQRMYEPQAQQSLGSFRPASTEHSYGGLDGARDLYSFGALASNGVYQQPADNVGHYTVSNSHHNLQTYPQQQQQQQQQFNHNNFGTTSTTQSNGHMPTQTSNLYQYGQDWDDLMPFAGEHHTANTTNLGMAMGIENTMPADPLLNPLFSQEDQANFNQIERTLMAECAVPTTIDHPAFEEDEDTISGPLSARHSPLPSGEAAWV